MRRYGRPLRSAVRLIMPTSAIRGLFRKLGRALRRRGVGGTLGLVGTKLRIMARRGTPDTAYDDAHGVDTSGNISLADLDIKSRNWEYGVRYTPTVPEVFHEMMGHLQIEHEKFTFIDYGAGKGRVLLMAADYGFRRVIGVEFSSELCVIANENIARARGVAAGDRVICECADAVDYRAPEDPLVIYFYNPFEENIMRAVLENLGQSLRATRREVYVLYYNPVLLGLLEAQPEWNVIGSGDDFAILRAHA